MARNDEDFLLALKLQNELDGLDVKLADATNKRKYCEENEFNLNATQNIVHPVWETIDPTPDIYSLFGAFDIKFFQGKLKCVELEWSKRMYQCAGICYQRRNRLGMSITIRLSEPLLKLRSRRNLIETLLHEMVHAYLFILNIRESNGGHGPYFQKIMNGINKTAGTNITVYHNFHDEVELYRTHVWRCNGICQHRKPFYGWIRRSSNRAPGPNDFWWTKHQETCGGHFQKLSEPEPKRKTSKKAIEDGRNPKITQWFDKNGNSKPAFNPKGINFTSNVNKGSGTIVIRSPSAKTDVTTQSSNKDATINISSTSIGGNLRNVVGFKDLNSSVQTVQKPSTPILRGSGHVLGTSAGQPSTSSNISAHDNIRNIWGTRFNNITTSIIKPQTATKQSDPGYHKSDIQRPSKLSLPARTWKELDNDILIQEIHHDVINISDNDESDDEKNTVSESVHIPNVSEHKRLISIKQELIEDLGDNDSVIELIDDEYDDDLKDESLEILSDTSVIDDIFGTDTLMSDFKTINDVVMNDPENYGNPNKEIITCPICQDQMPREQLSDHLDGCTGIVIKVEKKKTANNAKKPKTLPFYKKPSTSTAPVRILSPRDISSLRAAGYNDSVIESAEERAYNARILSEMRAEKMNTLGGGRAQPIETVNELNNGSNRENSSKQLDCPNCDKKVISKDINDHLDVCLQSETSPMEQGPPELLECPCCNQQVQAARINEHIDDCLGPL